MGFELSTATIKVDADNRPQPSAQARDGDEGAGLAAKAIEIARSNGLKSAVDWRFSYKIDRKI